MLCVVCCVLCVVCCVLCVVCCVLCVVFCVVVQENSPPNTQPHTKGWSYFIRMIIIRLESEPKIQKFDYTLEGREGSVTFLILPLSYSTFLNSLEVILFKNAANINFFSSSFKVLRPSMVFMLVYLIGVLLFLESSSALSHYDVLGISRSSSAETIMKSFNKLSERRKPDKNMNDPGANKRYAALRLAYKILGDATSKEIYDRMLQSSELEDKDTVSQQDRGKNMDRVIVGTYIPANDHTDSNSQTVGIISSICSCFSFHHF